jgi:hypothetical protein
LGTYAQQPVLQKPRVVISTDIGGTDPDDNQSMSHLLMFNDLFDLEGLVSSPSYGNGSKEEILRMIDVYERDYPKLRAHVDSLHTPEQLRSLCKQGRHGAAPFRGWDKATEGSQWIVDCARRKDARPLWILVWGGLEDLAQALHDAPDIARKIRVYWIGGPNKKWSVNAYSYLVSHFPNLWFIENNSTYRGFIANGKDREFYNQYMAGAGALGDDFVNYYNGSVKMGDSPSLFYMMDGNPSNPGKESWGGSFERISQSPRSVITRQLTAQDTVTPYSVMEFRLRGPKHVVGKGDTCFSMTIDKQNWEGIYSGHGIYTVRYSPKAPAHLHYSVTSKIAQLNGLHGEFIVDRSWPGRETKWSYPLGPNWYTDRSDPQLFEKNWQGAKTVRRWRKDILQAWAKRLEWLKM